MGRQIRVFGFLASSQPSAAMWMSAWGQPLTLQRAIKLVRFAPAADIAADKRRVNALVGRGSKKCANSARTCAVRLGRAWLVTGRPGITPSLFAADSLQPARKIPATTGLAPWHGTWPGLRGE
jgi:hypothetical protein